ncbi:MAG: riboflavin kinase [Pseudomonadota bacterium]|nr:riboflavin kinase [Pseudomonadota bacterium]
MKNLKDIHIQGTVVHGAKRGRELGFPTANIELSEKQLKTMPKIGIYAGYVHCPSTHGDKTLMGAISWGFNPTFGLKNPQLEVHILDFDHDIYDQQLSINFVEFIRGEVSFTTLEALVEKMGEDCLITRQILKGGNIG